MVQFMEQTRMAFDESPPNYNYEIQMMHDFLFYHIATINDLSKILCIPKERLNRYKVILEKLRLLVVVEDEQYLTGQGADHLASDPYLVEEILIKRGLSTDPEDWQDAA